MALRAVPGPLSPAERAAVRGVADRATAADGVAPLDEAALLAVADDEPGAHLHVLALEDPGAAPSRGASEHADPSGRVVGYAFVDRGGAVPTAQVVVDPAARRHGIGRALLEAAAGPDTTGEQPPGPLEAWAHGDLTAARALAAAAGFAAVEELWRMSLDLRGAAPVQPVWPDGIVVRPFRPGHDEEAWLAVNARAFADHPEQGRWTDHDLAAREREPWFDPAGFLLAARADGRIAGFAWTKVHGAGELADEPVGEVYVLGVDPAAQGEGLGRALTAAALAHLSGRGLRTAVLWVAGGNAAAIRTYRRAGFVRAALDVRYARPAAVGTRPPEGATMGS
jgi:mycothiol synthase